VHGALQVRARRNRAQNLLFGDLRSVLPQLSRIEVRVACGGVQGSAEEVLDRLPVGLAGQSPCSWPVQQVDAIGGQVLA